jgi:hypothetical protein
MPPWESQTPCHLNIFSQSHENIKRNEIYIHSFFNCAISIIFGQVHAPASLLPGKNPLISLYESDIVLYFSSFSAFWHEICCERKCWGCKQKSDEVSKYLIRRQRVQSNSWRCGVHFKESYCLHINSRLVQWEDMFAQTVGAKIRFASLKHSSGTSLCYVSFQKDQTCACICTSTLVALPNIFCNHGKYEKCILLYSRWIC